MTPSKRANIRLAEDRLENVQPLAPQYVGMMFPETDASLNLSYSNSWRWLMGTKLIHGWQFQSVPKNEITVS